MAGYATLSPTLAGGPPGWVIWAVGGTLITVGTIWAGTEIYDMTRSHSRERVEPKTISKAKTSEKCKKKRYTVRVHAQGTDCGGTSRSTIGMPALTKPIPIIVLEGLSLSTGTWGLLSRSQKRVRETTKIRADDYIKSGPSVGGRFGTKSFLVSDCRGGKRYDVDCFGSGKSFVI